MIETGTIRCKKAPRLLGCRLCEVTLSFVYDYDIASLPE